MELHCSQTRWLSRCWALRFETPMELHCSQTAKNVEAFLSGLRPLWNYTALKLHPLAASNRSVWDPYGITLLSNALRQMSHAEAVWDPYGITLLSNYGFVKEDKLVVWDPYGITLLSNPTARADNGGQFETPMELHCSQTSYSESRARP